MNRAWHYVVFLCLVCAEFLLLVFVPWGCFLFAGAMLGFATPCAGVCGAAMVLFSLHAMPRVEEIADGAARRLWP